MKILFFLLITLNLSQASDPWTLSDEEQNPDTQDILIKKSDKYLRNESMIYDLNTDLGIKDQRKYTGTDSHKFGLAGHVSGDYEHFSDILGVEFNYMYRSKSYNQMWYGFQVFQHKTLFNSITQNITPEAGDNANDESQYQRPQYTKNTISSLGIGIGHRFKLLTDFFSSDDVFEMVEVYGNYIVLNESFIKKQYLGYGLSTNYGIHKRSSSHFFYGGKFSYNLASVSREAIGNEKKSDRSLSLGWLSMAFEMGWFF
jgi:hypothetical protein